MNTNNETKWLVRALVTLAKRHLADANATPEAAEALEIIGAVVQSAAKAAA